MFHHQGKVDKRFNNFKNDMTMTSLRISLAIEETSDFSSLNSHLMSRFLARGTPIEYFHRSLYLPLCRKSLFVKVFTEKLMGPRRDIPFAVTAHQPFGFYLQIQTFPLGVSATMLILKLYRAKSRRKLTFLCDANAHFGKRKRSSKSLLSL